MVDVSSLKANWHLQDLYSDLDDADPFETVEPDVRVQDVGLLIDLRDDASLNKRIFELVSMEGALYERDVRCAVKDAPDTTCAACPLSGKDPAIASLCRLGAEQERIATELVIVRARAAGKT